MEKYPECGYCYNYYNCYNCYKQDTYVVIKKETYKVLGKQDIEIDADVLMDGVTKEEIFCPKFDDANLIRAFDKYAEENMISLYKYLPPLYKYVRLYVAFVGSRDVVTKKFVIAQLIGIDPSGITFRNKNNGKYFKGEDVLRWEPLE